MNAQAHHRLQVIRVPEHPRTFQAQIDHAADRAFDRARAPSPLSAANRLTCRQSLWLLPAIGLPAFLGGAWALSSPFRSADWPASVIVGVVFWLAAFGLAFMPRTVRIARDLGALSVWFGLLFRVGRESWPLTRFTGVCVVKRQMVSHAAGSRNQLKAGITHDVALGGEDLEIMLTTYRQPARAATEADHVAAYLNLPLVSAELQLPNSE